MFSPSRSFEEIIESADAVPIIYPFHGVLGVAQTVTLLTTGNERGPKKNDWKSTKVNYPRERLIESITTLVHLSRSASGSL
jgi:hypothetical protein